MSTTRLYIINRDNQEIAVDLFTNDAIALNFAVQDLESFDTSTPYSQTFRIPFSHINSHVFSPAVVTAFTDDFKKKWPARITSDTVEVSTGHIQLKEVIQSGDARWEEIVVVFYGEQRTFSADLQDLKLKDLEGLEAFNRLLDFSEISAESDGDVLWTVLERGWKLGGNGPQPINSVDTPLYPGHATACINGRTLWDLIFTNSGWNYTCPNDFVDNILSQYWIPWLNTRGNAVEEDLVSAKFKTSKDPEYLIIPNADSYTTEDANWTEVFDTGSDLTAGVFTAPFTGFYTFSWGFKGQGMASTYPGVTGGGNTVNHLMNFRFLPTTWTTGDPIPYQWAGQLGNAINEWPLSARNEWGGTFQVFMHVGDTYNFGATNITLGTAEDLHVNIFEWTFELSAVAECLDAGVFDFKRNAPDFKAIDWIRDMIKLHRLVITTDKLQPKTLVVDTYNDWLYSTASEDWTNKIDYSKDISIKSPADSQPQYIFTYAKGNDVLSGLFTDRTYGDQKVNDINNDFTTGDKKIELVTKSTPGNAITDTPVIVYKFVDKDGNFVAPGLRIGYNAATTGFVFWNEGADAAESVELPIISHYSQLIPDSTSLDLNFGPETPLHTTNGTPYLTAYYRFWKRFVDEMLSPESRIMEASAILTSADIANLDFSRKLWIRDSWWKLEKVEGWVDQNTICKLTLTKAITASPDCSFTPSTVSTTGVVSWVDAEDNPVDGTQLCCELNGWTWNGSVCNVFSDGGRPAIVGGTGSSTDNVQPNTNDVANTGSNSLISSPSSEVITGTGNTILDSIGVSIIGNDNSIQNYNSSIGSENLPSIVIGNNNLIFDSTAYPMIVGTGLVQDTSLAAVKGVHIGTGDSTDVNNNNGILIHSTLDNTITKTFIQTPVGGTYRAAVTLDTTVGSISALNLSADAIFVTSDVTWFNNIKIGGTYTTVTCQQKVLKSVIKINKAAAVYTTSIIGPTPGFTLNPTVIDGTSYAAVEITFATAFTNTPHVNATVEYLTDGTGTTNISAMYSAFVKDVSNTGFTVGFYSSASLGSGTWPIGLHFTASEISN